ncbi:hypothetical protein D3Y57_02935 (plasmid) [Sphingomonas paeninsulae]|jgi:hypothetical protein|uniref:Uncharacterized protein n=1 Tax=Sphingomonas paeninsulae TaxID=2319844 RepID=A0A494THV8_SPHPE|nr:hypothetical protein [Sphingomonas paeninsulae]AYJ85018.1 hypothetical protein D3Y57_02935 [Sphingomonas paeninsulae]
MKKNALVLSVVGIVMTISAVVMLLTGGPPKADPAVTAQCQQRMSDQGAEMMKRCDEAAFATAMTATDANTAARAISAANNAEIGGNALAMFLLGLGIVLTIGGVIASRRNRPM